MATGVKIVGMLKDIFVTSSSGNAVTLVASKKHTIPVVILLLKTT